MRRNRSGLRRVRKALEAVPRELFIPDTIWIRREDGWAVPLRRADDPERWRQACLSDEPVITQVDDGAEDKGVWPTSSSSAPHVMATMIDALDLDEGMRVLEIGAGTGYNAAILAHIAGAENVTTVEIDATLADHARHALRRAGYPVEVVTGDGIHGYPDNAPYDRIIVTAAVHEVPYAWIEQTRPGGLILVPWAPTFHPDGPLAALTVRADGTAEGRFGSPAWFMPLRGQRRSQRVLQQARERWVAAGKPDATRFGVTVTPDGQRIWLDSPDNPVSS